MRSTSTDSRELRSASSKLSVRDRMASVKGPPRSKTRTRKSATTAWQCSDPSGKSMRSEDSRVEKGHIQVVLALDQPHAPSVGVGRLEQVADEGLDDFGMLAVEMVQRGCLGGRHELHCDRQRLPAAERLHLDVAPRSGQRHRRVALRKQQGALRGRQGKERGDEGRQQSLKSAEQRYCRAQSGRLHCRRAPIEQLHEHVDQLFSVWAAVARPQQRCRQCRELGLHLPPRVFQQHEEPRQHLKHERMSVLTDPWQH
eukprot:scaffold22132_cov119-Isochrysis_galbana.AAC.7